MKPLISLLKILDALPDKPYLLNVSTIFSCPMKLTNEKQQLRSFWLISLKGEYNVSFETFIIIL